MLSSCLPPVCTSEQLLDTNIATGQGGGRTINNVEHERLLKYNREVTPSFSVPSLVTYKRSLPVASGSLPAPQWISFAREDYQNRTSL